MHRPHNVSMKDRIETVESWRNQVLKQYRRCRNICLLVTLQPFPKSEFERSICGYHRTCRVELIVGQDNTKFAVPSNVEGMEWN